MENANDEHSAAPHCYLHTLTQHDWQQIEMAARGGVSGTSKEWPHLVIAIEKVLNRKLMPQPSSWLRGFCEALVLSK